MDRAEEVAEHIARNPQTPASILDTLSRRWRFHIRRHVAENPSTPLSLLQTFLRDKHFAVQNKAELQPPTRAKNKKCLGYAYKLYYYQAVT